MTPCPDRHDTILLAAFGELSAAELEGWERHKTVCPACRDEYAALLRLLARIKEAMPAPELSEKSARSILWSVKQGLKKEREKSPWWKEWFVRPGRLVPALATACIVLIAFGWFGLDSMRAPSTPHEGVGPTVENQALVRDLEVIKNIEFLEEMDTVQELVDKLDRKQAI